jgi:hypothetical protein
MPLLLIPCLIKEACIGVMFFGEVCCEQGLNLCPEIGSGGGQKANRVADKRRQQLIHFVTEIREAGIKLRKRKTARFWDIKFKKGVLPVPRLLIPNCVIAFNSVY